MCGIASVLSGINNPVGICMQLTCNAILNPQDNATSHLKNRDQCDH